MAVGILVCFCVLALPVEPLQIATDDVSWGKEHKDCLPLKNTIADAITSAAISFFADNPRENRTFDPNEVEPFSPYGLFKHYYGEEASAAEFWKVLSLLTYSAAESTGNFVDRNELRRNLYDYIRAGSYEYAREIGGHLLWVIVDEFVKDSDSWKKQFCVDYAPLNNVLEAIEVECYRIRNEVGDVKFGQYFALGVGSTLAFAIDDTGSMSGEIAAAKKRAQTIVKFTEGTLDAPQDFVLVPFNDPEVGPVTVTNKASQYHDALGKLYAHGGGDAPELAMRGIQLAIENSRPGSIVYVISDIDAKDYALQDTVVAQARQKSTVVTFLLTNRISECADTRGYKRCMGLYEYIARQTGGKVLVIGRDDIFRATDIVQAYAKQGVVLLKQATIIAKPKEPHGVINFHVDGTLQELLFEAQGSCENVYISGPVKENGHEKIKQQRYGDIWTSMVNLKSSNKSRLGQWSIGFDVREKNCSVKIQAKTTMGFLLTLLSENEGTQGKDFKILREDPFVGSSVALLLDAYGLRVPHESDAIGDHATSLKFLNERGRVLQTVPVPKNTGDTITHVFRGGISQMEPFRVMIEGRDKEGYSFQRMFPRLLAASHVRIECDLSALVFVSGEEAITNITIRNYGPEDQFLLTTSDEFGASSFHDYTKNRKIKIGKDSNLTKSLRLFVDKNTRDGTAIKITLTAKGKLPGSFQYTVCTVVVGQKKKPRIDAFSITTTINARLAETVITSQITNNADIGREAEFDVLLPQNAFITAIRIELHNETIHGVVREKNKAKKIYDKAKKKGTVAGHVAARDTSTRAFRTSMFVEARQKVQFVLTYQELLRRVRGRYEYGVIINPDQPIRSLTIDIHITEENRLSFVRVQPFKTTLANVLDDTPAGSSITYSLHNTAAHVRYHPDLEEQTKLSPKGLSGTFVMEYDVFRPELFGQISINNGYFAHFFAPPDLPPMPKIVVFVVDTSGSMYGFKMKQLKAALTSTLNDLNPEDKFNVIVFGDEARPWANESVLPATKLNVADAVAFVRELEPRGGTNVASAFEVLINKLGPHLPKLDKDEESSGWEGSSVVTSNAFIDSEEHELLLDDTEMDLKEDEAIDLDSDSDLDTYTDNYAKMVVFMTDGRPSVGVTDTKVIGEMVKNRNQGRFILHTVGLGSLVDFGFLDKLAKENGGSSRRIFEGIEADVQIRNFLEEVTNPLLRDVTIEYPEDSVEDLTSNTFSVFLGGTELVVAGRVRPDNKKVAPGFDPLGEDLPSPTDQLKRGITAQVRGRTFEDDLEIDFDLDPEKQSKITQSPHQISNFTQKLWAFLRLKELLLQVAIAENETVKNNFNEKALNLSLRYEFVTPLTSLVVLRSDERIALEKELKKEFEEKTRKLEEERKELMRKGISPPSPDDDDAEYEAESFALDVHDAPRIATTRAKLGRSRGGGRGGGGGGGGGGGFSGDPHFIIPIQPGINICFNWDGKEGEVYNLIHDPEESIVVNAMLANSPAPPSSGRVRRTYVTAIGIVLPRIGKRILITPWNITVVEEGAANFTLSGSARLTLKFKDVFNMKVENVSHASSTVVIDYHGVSFAVILRRNNAHLYSRDHLDFSLLNDLRSLSRRSEGVFGQFASLFRYPHELPKAGVVSSSGKLSDDQVRSEVYIRGRFIPVVKKRMLMPGTDKDGDCWYIHKNGARAMRKQKQAFQQRSLFEIPAIK